MARKSGSKMKTQRKLNIPKNFHFLYSTHEFGDDATVVRYLGEQDGDYLYCFHPEGFAMWIHLHQLSNMPSRQLAVA